MEYLYAGLLLHKAGTEITDASLTKVLKAAGVTVDTARVKTLVAALSEIDIEEALSSATAMPMMAAAAPATTAASAGDAGAKQEAEEEEEEEEEGEEVEDDEGLGSLFG